MEPEITIPFPSVPPILTCKARCYPPTLRRPLVLLARPFPPHPRPSYSIKHLTAAVAPSPEQQPGCRTWAFRQSDRLDERRHFVASHLFRHKDRNLSTYPPTDPLTTLVNHDLPHISPRIGTSRHP